MSLIDDIGGAAKSGVIGGVVGGVSGAVGNLFTNTGHQQRAAKRYQFDIMRGQHDLNEVAADSAAKRQKDLWDYTFNKTNVKGTAKQYEDAGFNPLLAVTQSFGGGGGSATGGTAPQGSTGPGASIPIDTKAGSLQAMSSLAATSKELELMDAQKRNIDADTQLKLTGANKNTSEVKTIEEQRAAIVAKLKEEAILGRIERVMAEYRIHDGEGSVGGGPSEAPENYVVKVAKSSMFARQLEGELGYLTENTELTKAERLLTDQKKSAIWRELLIAQGELEVARMNADSNAQNAASRAVEAKATAMAAEFNYGEEANWKWWTEKTIEGGKAIVQIVQAVTGKTPGAMGKKPSTTGPKGK